MEFRKKMSGFRKYFWFFLCFVIPFFYGCASTDSSGGSNEPEDDIKEIVIEKTSEKSDVEAEISDKISVEAGEKMEFEKTEVDVPEEIPEETVEEEKRAPAWYNGLRNFDIKEGYLRIKIKPSQGIFNLQALMYADPEDENYNKKISVPVVSTSNEYHTTSLYLKANNDIYKLNENSSIKYAARRIENGVQIKYRVPKVADVILEFFFEKSTGSDEIDTLRVTSTVINISRGKKEFALKLLFDTVLGEADNNHFYDSRNNPIKKAGIYRDFEKDPWFTSKNSKAEFQIIMNGKDCTKPDFVALSNYTSLVSTYWEPTINSYRGFGTIHDYSNSAAVIAWPSKKLAVDQANSEVFYLSFGVNGKAAGGGNYVVNYGLGNDAEELEQKAPDSIPVIQKIPAVSDGSAPGSTAAVEKIPGASEIVVDEPVNDSLISAVPSDTHSSIENSEKSGEVIGAVSEPVQKSPSKNQLTNDYIQGLLNRIHSLEESDTPIDREELLMLNAELDSILEYLRTR